MKLMPRVASLTIATAVAGAALLVPATAQAAAATTAAATPGANLVAQPAGFLAEDSANGACVVTDGSMTWGVKESFRTYILGTIANGSWEATEGATYETPNFGWSAPTGEIDASTGEGVVKFPGRLAFSGHGGTLNLNLVNPSIEFIGDGTARILMDATSQKPNGEISIDKEQAYLGKIEATGPVDATAGEVTFTDARVVLTSDGAAAFGGDFYSSGEELDPISVSLQFGPCVATETPGGGVDQPAEPEVTAAAPVNEQASEPGAPWLPIIVGGVAVAVIAVAATLLIAGRNKSGGVATDSAATDSAADGAGGGGD